MFTENHWEGNKAMIIIKTVRFPGNFLTYTRFASVLVRMECLKVACTAWLVFVEQEHQLSTKAKVVSLWLGRADCDILSVRTLNQPWQLLSGETTAHTGMISVITTRMSLVLKASNRTNTFGKVERLHSTKIRQVNMKQNENRPVDRLKWYSVLHAKTCIFLARLKENREK